MPGAHNSRSFHYTPQIGIPLKLPMHPKVGKRDEAHLQVENRTYISLATCGFPERYFSKYLLMLFHCGRLQRSIIFLLFLLLASSVPPSTFPTSYDITMDLITIRNPTGLHTLQEKQSSTLNDLIRFPSLPLFNTNLWRART